MVILTALLPEISCPPLIYAPEEKPGSLLNVLLKYLIVK